MDTTTTETKLTAEELRTIALLLDRVQTRGIREAEALIHVVRKLQLMAGETT